METSRERENRQRRRLGDSLMVIWMTIPMLVLCIVGFLAGYALLSAVVAIPVVLLMVVGIHRVRQITRIG